MRIPRNTHILQYLETVNAPAERAGRRGPVGPLGAVFWLIFYYADVFSKAPAN